MYENGRSIPRTENGRKEFKQNVESSILKIIQEIVDTPEIIRKKGEAALHRIKINHSISDHLEKIQSLYNSIL